ncbi:MAG: hypothetical protein EAZ85_02710 [Bacteroidetes bacterium]|nr:MAG: hypothetical protein EAZ85_02710 [Bacteroidota bacterium]TAG86226.1 MAG: hypothetical protein EAZ20_13245 [Bacteroidota bacterium]
MKNILFFILIISFFTACTPKQEEPNLRDLGLDFYPLQENFFWEYEVKEISYTLINPPVAFTYQIREELKELFIGLDNLPAYRYEKYKRNTNTDAWVIDSTGFVQKSNYWVRKSANNLIFTKLAFPFQEGKTWNGNAYNNLGAKDFQMKDVRKPYQLSSSQNFSTAVKVIQINDSSLVALKRRIEVYAQDVGLIEASYKNLNYCTATNCVGQGIVRFGSDYNQKLLRYGKL